MKNHYLRTLLFILFGSLIYILVPVGAVIYTEDKCLAHKKWGLSTKPANVIAKSIYHARRYILYAFNRSVYATEDIRQYYTDQNLTTALYKLVDEVGKTLDAHKITWWADSGTLLGAVRHRGLIPADDDGDLVIMCNSFEKLQKVKEDLKAKGIELVGDDFKPFGGRLIKAFLTAEKKKEMGLDSLTSDFSAFVDLAICFTVSVNGEKEYTYYFGRKKLNSKYRYKVADMFPLRKVPFGPTHVYIPRNPYPNLDRVYPGWRENILIDRHHTDNLVPRYYKTTPENCCPAPWDASQFA